MDYRAYRGEAECTPVAANPPSHAYTPPTSEVGLELFPGLVASKFKSLNGKLFLSALAGQYGTSYEKQDSDENDDARGGGQRQPGVYLEKQDNESGKVEKATTRN